MAALEFFGEAPHLSLGRQVGLHELDRRVAGLLPNLGRDRLALVPVPSDSDHRRALPARPPRSRSRSPPSRPSPGRLYPPCCVLGLSWILLPSAACVVRDVAWDVDAAAQFRVVDRAQRLQVQRHDARPNRQRVVASSSTGGPVRILAEALSMRSAMTVVASNSFRFGWRASAQRPGAMCSVSASSATSFSSSVPRACPCRRRLPNDSSPSGETPSGRARGRPTP